MNVKESEPAQADLQASWMCAECGYIYDPAEGNLETNIRPGMPFDKLPDDWSCPVCNHPKNQFTKFISQL
ncbi:MAG TPA: Rubredoxin-1 [Chlorobaculum sp.]|jgi:rubredoxin|uniref:Rubredoxin-1 n=1 Tax=Chlorobaculum tepidum (strain ATCC 49652 / DSM 12025 / NBRC 103806 / TLS) TaxID=194439 RepID=RUBR1_CHLTE|nr:rubredoxin [Chlorobaculum tepidum]P58992.1 RecName: Full=Rubredoxin-1; Short=Rd 1 [Chlorobaculum tepidum TLS]AAM72333.1 rubredoxin [Chlorobaculum tepidum TLS]HBU22712.1 Rubredoxin-1 [Chlorobaculum sp.]